MKDCRLIPVAFAVAILAAYSLCLSACSASLTDGAVVTLWGGDLAVPKLGEVRAVARDRLEVSFSGPVTVMSAEVVPSGDPGETAMTPVAVTWESAEGGLLARFTMADPPAPGQKAALSAVVSDAKGNTLSFASPFVGFNDRVPRLRLSEVRMDYSKPKVEYLEMVALTAGNLGGVQIVNSANADATVREFPPVEVREGEFIVWHFRSVEEGLVNELEALDESGGTNASPLARDFWDDQARSPFKKTNVVFLRERAGGAILDALLCAEEGKADWPTDALGEAALEAVRAGVWKPGAGVSDAARAVGMSPTRTLARDSALTDTDTAADWIVCATGKCSPGLPNAPR
jgi:hypothetical protein